MNLAYRYLMNRLNVKYQQGKTYLLLKNIDNTKMHINQATIMPGECFIVDEDDYYRAYQLIIADKKVAKLKTLKG